MSSKGTCGCSHPFVKKNAIGRSMPAGSVPGVTAVVPLSGLGSDAPSEGIGVLGWSLLAGLGIVVVAYAVKSTR